MFVLVLSALFDLRVFMAASALFALFLAAAFLLALPFFSWKNKCLRFFGAFFALGFRARFALSLLYLRWSFLFVCLFLMSDIHAIQLLLLAALGLLAGLAVSGIPGCLRELINSALLAAGLIVANFLVSYMTFVHFDWSIFAVYSLLALFILLYSLFFFIRDLRSISKQRRSSHVQF